MTKPADKPQWVRIAEQFEHSRLAQKQFAQQQRAAQQAHVVGVQA